MAFDNIKGQEVAVTFLKHAIKKEAFPPTLIFVGRNGTGRKLTAKTFAKAINCETKSGNSCDKCKSCIAIDSNVHPNVLMIGGDGNAIGIDEVRKVINSSYVPINHGFKVNIFDGIDNASEEAFNSMLKYFEEPPDRTINILILENADNLPETVRSRSIELKFRPLSREIVKEVLSKNGVDEGLLDTLSHVSLGSLERIKPYLEQGGLEKRKQLLKGLLEFIRGDNTAGGVMLDYYTLYGNEVNKENLNLFIEECINLIHDILLVSLLKDPNQIVNVDLLGYFADKFFAFDTKKLMSIFKVFEKGKDALLTNASPTYIMFYLLFGIERVVH